MTSGLKLGHTDISIGKIAYGCWRFAQRDVATADRLIRTALDAGMNLIDTADIYGFSEFPDREDKGFGQAEVRLGEVLAAAPSLRKQMVLTTKGGIDAVRPYDSSYRYILAAMDASLTRLQTDYVDLYQIHRPDLSTPMRETARALNEIVQSGKARHIGVSNFTVAQTRALQSHLDAPIVTLQPEFSAIQQDSITDGTLDYGMETGATVLAWSPLGGGRLPTEDGAVQAALDEIALRYGISRSVAALAFTRAHGADVVPIIGTQTPERITESGYAAQINLTGREFYDVVEAYRGQSMP
jgi:aryl-alcohol dehydrogenase-like predicted oxidoreductase